MDKGPDIRLDESRAYSTVHGDRNPGDPHYRVHSFQDGLPFGAEGVLVPDDGKRERWSEAIEREDGTTKIVWHDPLYTDAMRKTLDKKLKKLASTKRVVTKTVKAPTDEDADEQAPVFGPDEVNLTSWLRGEINYEPNEIFAAVKKRYGISLTRLREVVIELVDDQKLVPESEVSQKLIVLLDDVSAAA
jgi:hypothetical protein